MVEVDLDGRCSQEQRWIPGRRTLIGQDVIPQMLKLNISHSLCSIPPCNNIAYVQVRLGTILFYFVKRCHMSDVVD